MKRRKLGIALGAGGSRGIAHIGFLQAIEEAGIRPDFITGSSMGAIVGGCYAAGVSPSEMKKVALNLKLGKIAAFNFAPLKENGLMRLRRAHDLLEGYIGGITFREMKIPFSCVATDLMTGKTVVLDDGLVIDAVLASGSIPGVFTPARFGKYEMLSDGGILERVPAKQVKEMGADVVVAVDVLGNLLEKEISRNLVGTMLRYIDIMDFHNTQRERESRKYIDLWLEPDLGRMDQYKVKHLEFAYAQGYKLGRKHTKEILRLVGA